MKCKIEKSKISGQIICPPNKSYTHRAIFLASLAGKTVKLKMYYFQQIQKQQLKLVKNLEQRLKPKIHQ